jgi:hypothetical protein
MHMAVLAASMIGFVGLSGLCIWFNLDKLRNCDASMTYSEIQAVQYSMTVTTVVLLLPTFLLFLLAAGCLAVEQCSAMTKILIAGAMTAAMALAAFTGLTLPKLLFG